MTIFHLGGGILGHLRFGLSDNFNWGVFWDTSDLDSDNFHWGVCWDTSDLDSDNFHLGGGILGHLRFGLSDNFHFGRGYSGTPQIWTLWQFSFGGGYSGTPRIWTVTIFIGGEGVFYRIGVFCGIWTKISTTPAGSCITDSLSHTTYVETKLF